MLTIRAEQMRKLTDANIRTAIQDMMSEHFPIHCSYLGRAGYIQAVRDAIGRGRTLGFQNPQLPAYVALEFSFGADFSTNRAYPWAQEILQDRSLTSESRMHELRTGAIFYLAKLVATQTIKSEASA